MNKLVSKSGYDNIKKLPAEVQHLFFVVIKWGGYRNIHNAFVCKCVHPFQKFDIDR